MKFSIYLIAVLALISCKKESNLNNLLINERINASELFSASTTLTQVFADSLNTLASDFNLKKIEGVVDRNSSIIEEFNDIASARLFLQNLERSEVVNENKPLSIPNNSNSQSGFSPRWGYVAPIDFQFEIPSRIFKFREWSWRSPVGFVISGYLHASSPRKSSANSVWFEQWELKEMNVNLYGPRIFTSWESSYSYFQRLYTGSHGQFSFAGTVSMVVLIKDIGTIYSIPLSGRIVAKMGPYYVNYFGDVESSPYSTQMVSYYVSR
ncbi:MULTISPECIES: hypothetical protein [unclassified Sphingobacterium]|uniref:hypothetical protein n=1 Tax=unclassified Sphingobacterium TaxID=2609468 RepID=UPI0025F786DD|nr:MULTISPECIES: hypothetical protein [unclassified Sphingobacterium]